MPIDTSSRLFNCLGCRAQVIICRYCDRGNIYCGPNCAMSARKESLKLAAQRYQQTRGGKHKHAERQRRYRSRQAKSVTHHSSISGNPKRDSAVANAKKVSEPVLTQGYCCSFCGNGSARFLRSGFLRHQISRRSILTKAQPLGP